MIMILIYLFIFSVKINEDFDHTLDKNLFKLIVSFKIKKKFNIFLKFCIFAISLCINIILTASFFLPHNIFDLFHFFYK